MFNLYVCIYLEMHKVYTLWNASSYRQPLEQEGNPMT